ncbi:MAG: hypothetical protein H0X66_11110 [Verrucomicrobia bacterium]|nr:hypothetical protein [Verrucomicrobiota bacterium]
MNLDPINVTLGIVAAAAGILFARRFLSPEARERRRRRRNYARPVQKGNRPMVKFTVSSPDKKKK